MQVKLISPTTMISIYNVSAMSNKKITSDQICLLIGNFTTLHLGHQALIKQAREYSDQKGLKLVLLTFSPNTKSFIKNEPELLFMDQNSRIKLLESWGVDIITILKFTKLIKGFSCEKFHHLLQNFFNIQAIFVGEDFKYGVNQSGNHKTLSEVFNVKTFKDINYNYEKISSSKIQKLIQGGHVQIARNYLGRSYRIKGIVEQNKGQGSSIGIPTANIKIPAQRIIPHEGIYATFVNINDEPHYYEACTYIGTASTMNCYSQEDNFRIESHIFNFNGNIVDSKINILFYCFLRHDHHYMNVASLKKQIMQDIKVSKLILQNIKIVK